MNWLQGFAGDWIRALALENDVQAALNVSNVFTAARQEVQNNVAADPALVINVDAGADAHVGNIWKNLFEAKVASVSGYVNFYSGRASSQDQFAITYNARWDVTSQTWTAHDTAKPTVALLFEGGNGLFSAQRAAGAGTWTDWRTFTRGDIGAARDVFANRNLFAAAAVIATTSFDLSVALTRTRQSVSLALAELSTGGAIYRDTANGHPIKIQNNNDGVLVPLRLPAGAVLSKVEVMINRAGTTNPAVDVLKTTNNWASPGAPSASALSGSSTNPTASGYNITDFHGMTEVIDNTAEYTIRIGNVSFPGAGADLKLNDLITGIAVTYSDPGPRNH
jgi:hypothetical protein